MVRSILITAIRNLYRHRTFSIINLAGLSVSMSLGLLIILIIKSQFNFDTFHSDSDRIYRINTRALRVDGGSESYATTPYPLSQVLKEDYSFAEEVICINRYFNADAEYGNTNVPVSGLFVDANFLAVFNFPLAKGNANQALTTPNSLVLSKETAERIFGTQEALGQVITVLGYGEFTITGVLAEFPGQSHFDFDMLGSTLALPQLIANEALEPLMDDWNNYYGSLTYIKLLPGKDISEVEEALVNISKAKYANLKRESRDNGYEFFAQALSDITPGPVLSNQMGRGMPTLLLVFFAVLGGIVLLMSCFNFTNLTIAKSLSRAREIGVRKVIGANRFQVFAQFIGETIAFAFIALFVSYIFLQFLKTGFLQLPFNEEFAITLNESLTEYLLFGLFAIVVGVMAGFLPALYLSGFKPARVLKDAAIVRGFSGINFRKALIVVQLSLSVIFVITILVIYNQVDFMLSADYGFNEKDKINVRLQGMEFDKLAVEVKSIPGVISVGGVSHRLGTWSDRSSDYKQNKEDKPASARDFFVDANYVGNIELTFLAGRNFDPANDKASANYAILNERALTFFGFDSPVSAIGQTIFAQDTVMLTVIGVVKDFHFRPFNVGIGPLVLRSGNSSEYGFLSALIVPGQKEAILATINSVWKKLDPVHPLEAMMMEEEIDDAYRQAGFTDLLVIVGYISLLAVTLACLGMLGMAMYLVQTRTKEVGIRKVMGASSQQVVYLLSRSFLFMIGLALLIGIPVSFIIGGQFLETFAYKIELTPWLILEGTSVIGVLGLITIGSQTWRAAAADPVKSLRYE
ncbi:ABC transporter permease [Oscillatoria amoena NRMC-F 0135]|nr:ABC transporter permease [Oscillatoria amoena NRMC-F 0135]